MSVVSIDHETCTRCRLCVTVCPLKILSMSDNMVQVDPRGDERCIRCGQCVSICPKASVTLLGVNPHSLRAGTCPVNQEDALQMMCSRRTVRHFHPDPLPKELLISAMEAARHAPSAYNKQPVLWLVLSDRERIQALAKLTADTLRSTRKKFFTLLADVYDGGRDVMLRDAPQVVIAYTKEGDELMPHDSSAATTYLELMLHSMGIGTCWIGYVLRAAHRNPAIAASLGLPEGCNLQAGLMVGRPKYTYLRVPPRNALDIRWE